MAAARATAGSSGLQKPQDSSRTLSGEVDGLTPHEDLLLASWTQTYGLRPTLWSRRHHSTSACSSSSSTWPPSTTASTTSTNDSKRDVGSSASSLSSLPIPIVSVGHLSEDTDFTALALELEEMAEKASHIFRSDSPKFDGVQDSNAFVRYDALSHLHHQTRRVRPRVGRKSTLNEHLEKLEAMERGVGVTVSSNVSTAPPAPLSDNQLYAQPLRGSRQPDQVAVLVDTDIGRRRQSLRPWLTLAQTLSQMQQDKLDMEDNAENIKESMFHNVKPKQSSIQASAPIRASAGTLQHSANPDESSVSHGHSNRPADLKYSHMTDLCQEERGEPRSFDLNHATRAIPAHFARARTLSSSNVSWDAENVTGEESAGSKVNVGHVTSARVRFAD